jgi:hypothetical protein
MVACAALLVWGAAWATVLITVEEALALAFPGATTERQTLFLSGEQRDRVAEDSGAEVTSLLATRYVAKGGDGAVRGWAYPTPIACVPCRKR